MEKKLTYETQHLNGQRSRGSSPDPYDVTVKVTEKELEELLKARVLQAILDNTDYDTTGNWAKKLLKEAADPKNPLFHQTTSKNSYSNVA